MNVKSYLLQLQNTLVGRKRKVGGRMKQKGRENKRDRGEFEGAEQGKKLEDSEGWKTLR